MPVARDLPVPSQFRQNVKRRRKWRETVRGGTPGKPAFQGVFPGHGERGARTGLQAWLTPSSAQARRRAPGRREYCLAREEAAELPSDSWALREAGMDRDVLDVIEREIDQEVRARFPGTAVRQAVLLQYGDDPRIEPGDLWVRVLLDEPDGPDDDWEPALTAFEQANEAAIEQFRGYLAAKLREIMAVEYVFGNNPVTFDGEGPRGGMPVAQRLSDISEWEHGEATFVLASAGTGWPGDGGHADHGGNRGHPRGGHPVGRGPRPRAASVPAARVN